MTTDEINHFAVAQDLLLRAPNQPIAERELTLKEAHVHAMLAVASATVEQTNALWEQHHRRSIV